MKKKLGLALVAACAGPAFAQIAATGAPIVNGSSMNMFGVLDAAVAWGDGSVNNNTRLVSGANTSSRLGFRGVEDLGAHLGAGFWLEAGVNPDDGTGAPSNSNNQTTGAGTGSAITFYRRSTVSLMNDWGELRLGRDFVATYRNRDQSDPFSTNGAGASLTDSTSIAGITKTRASNMVGYFLPAQFLGGFLGEAQYYMGETVGDSYGSGWQGRLGYTTKLFGVAVAGGSTRYAQTPTTGDTDVWSVAGHLDFGWTRFTAGYFEDKVKQTTALKGTGYIVGAVVPLDVSQIKLAYSVYGTDATGDPQARKAALGWVYNFSKRSAFYTTYAYVDNRGPSAVGLNGSTTAAGERSQGFDIGLKHSF